MDVGVNADCGCLEDACQYQIGDLSPYAGELQEFVHGVGDFASEAGLQDLRELVQMLCFLVVEAHGEY